MESIIKQTDRLLDLLGHDEAPFGVCYSDTKPDGFGPRPGEIFTREREKAGEINWDNAFGNNFSCLMGNVWLARKKRKAAWISHEECGCMGGGFYSGMYAPYLETNVRYVSTGFPGTPFEGERYLPSLESMRAFMEDIAPPAAPKKYCVIKPLEQFAETEQPLVIVFFARPEVINGLCSLTFYATGDHNAVASPFSAGCGSIIAWPLTYWQRGKRRAVLGGFDLSARKFMKTDELSFAIPFPLYREMLDVMEASALSRKTWSGVRKKVFRSRRAWGEEEKSV